MSGSAEHREWAQDVAAYVLGALADEEAGEFRRHLESCALCAAEVERLGAAAALLPLSVAQIDAPAHLRRRVLAAAVSERDGAPRGARTLAITVRSRFALIAAGGLAAGLVIGAFVLTPASQSTSVIRARVASASAWHSTVRPEAWLDRSGDSAELVVEHLPEPPDGEIYELWIERGGKPVATDALFEPRSSGRAEADVPGGLRGASAILVTAEPRGGTSVPTMAPLIAARLTD
jgi:anti-sigma-K factor RskA